MLNRSIKITFRLNSQENERLRKQVKKTGLSQESYLRTLIDGFIPKELPPLDYHDLVQELHSIGVNLNQIAAKANFGRKRGIYLYPENDDGILST